MDWRSRHRPSSEVTERVLKTVIVKPNCMPGEARGHRRRSRHGGAPARRAGRASRKPRKSCRAVSGLRRWWFRHRPFDRVDSRRWKRWRTSHAMNKIGNVPAEAHLLRRPRAPGRRAEGVGREAENVGAAQAAPADRAR